MPNNNYKVLHLISSGGLYGAESVILNLSQEMRKKSYMPIIGSVLSERSNGAGELAQAARELGVESMSFDTGSKVSFKFMYLLKKTLIDRKINLVHSHGYKTTLLALAPCKVLGIPLIATCHLWSNTGDLKLSMYHALEAKAMRFLPAVVGVSTEICRTLVGKGIPQEKVLLIPNGINLANYRKYNKDDTHAFLESLGVIDTDCIVGAIGRLAPQKAHKCLIDAIHILKNNNVTVKCLIIGEGPLRAQLERQCKQLGLNEIVYLPGFRKDIINLLERINIFVISSNDEGLPMVLLEAMALKSAIVSTPVGEIKHFIKQGLNGYVFPVGDSQALADYIAELVVDEEKRHAFGEKAFSTFVNNYTSSEMTRKYIKLYRSVLVESTQ